MKFLLLLLISFNIFAGSWIPKSLVGEDTDGLTIHSKRNKCEQAHSEPCIKIRGNVDLSIARVRPEAQLKDLAESCTDDCQAKLELLVCADEEWAAIKTEDEVYCTKFRAEKIVVDDDKKALKDAAKSAKAQEKADRKAERDEVRAFIQNVNDSALDPWHKKILRRLIRDMKDD